MPPSGPLPSHPIDVAVHAILQEGSTKWAPVPKWVKKRLAGDFDLRQAIAILTVGGALEQRLSYVIEKLGDDRKLTFTVEVCGDFTQKLERLVLHFTQSIWTDDKGFHGPGSLEAIRITADGKQAIDDYAIGITYGMENIWAQRAPGRAHLVDGPTVDGVQDCHTPTAAKGNCSHGVAVPAIIIEPPRPNGSQSEVTIEEPECLFRPFHDGITKGHRVIVRSRPNADACEAKVRNDDKEHAPTVPPEYLVTLQQAAAMVSRSKRTLERRLRDMPMPRVQGAGGKPSEWAWSELRPWLEKEYERQLPERFPADLTDTDRQT